MNIEISYTYIPSETQKEWEFVQYNRISRPTQHTVIIDTEYLGVDGRAALISIAKSADVNLFILWLPRAKFDLGELTAHPCVPTAWLKLCEKYEVEVSHTTLRKLFDQYS